MYIMYVILYVLVCVNELILSLPLLCSVLVYIAYSYFCILTFDPAKHAIPPDRRGLWDPRLSWRSDELVKRRGRESQQKAEPWASG